MKNVGPVTLAAGFATVALGLVYASLQLPWAAAALCPQCFGFEYVERNVYVENTARTSDVMRIRKEQEAARTKLIAFFGRLRAAPVVLICATEACYRKFEGRSGQTKGITFFDSVQVLSPRGSNAVIMAHELTHAEFHHRLGLVTAFDIPAWFDEGLAAYVSNDPRYIRPVGPKDRCVADPGGSLPVSRRDWLWDAANDHSLYAKAACRVSRWLDSNGGPSALDTLIVRVKNGTPFGVAYNGIRQ